MPKKYSVCCGDEEFENVSDTVFLEHITSLEKIYLKIKKLLILKDKEVTEKKKIVL